MPYGRPKPKGAAPRIPAAIALMASEVEAREFGEVGEWLVPQWNHDGRSVGEIVFLARNGSSLWAVGEVSDEVVEAVSVRVGGRSVAVPTPLYWSASRIGDLDYGFVLDSVALTASPASVDPRPVTFLDGRVDHRQAAQRWRSRLDRVEFELLERAAHTVAHRKRGDLITIAELDEPKLTKLGRGNLWVDADGELVGQTSLRYAADEYEPERPRGALRMRPAKIISVR